MYAHVMCMSAHNDTLENWNEVRTAYHVARLGTLSAAAEFLGVHHATVIRHIDALETRLQSKLFHRNPRGYMPTEAGRDLMQIAATHITTHLKAGMRSVWRITSRALVH